MGTTPFKFLNMSHAPPTVRLAARRQSAAAEQGEGYRYGILDVDGIGPDEQR